jgi:hypothetical protein
MAIVAISLIICLIGISVEDWTLIWIGGAPIVFGLLGGFLDIRQKRKIEERKQSDPEFREWYTEWERKYGKR